MTTGTGLEFVHMASPPPVTWKVVYWGPKGAGKTTCLRLSHHGRPAARVDVFSVPGCPACVATRGLILQRVDAVVFVADADPSRLAANRQAAFELIAALHAQGRDPAEVPIVVQLNKRELPQALPLAALREALRPLGAARQVLESVASLGEGVTPTLRLITRLLLTRAASAPDDRSEAAALPPAAASRTAPKPAKKPAPPAPARPPAGPARARDRGRSGRAPALAR